ncbi:MAG TPA: hypothetical protein VJR89_15165 [Polyangiales bacterium]|nr:hypothetical protein [Polyangiales bacterium]
MRRYLALWVVVTAALSVATYARARIELGPVPDRAAQSWTYAWLAAAASGKPRPDAPESAVRYRAAGPIVVSAYSGGRMRARFAGDRDLVGTLQRAATRFASQRELRPDRVFRVLVTRGEGPLLRAPGLELFSLVPLRDGLVARDGEDAVYVTPDDLVADERTDRAVKPPVPDLSFGTKLAPLVAELGAGKQVQRVVLTPLTAANPEPVVSPRAALDAARLHAQFILRHQAEDGRYAYVYDAHRDKVRSAAGYSLTRHAGTSFFLAQAARLLGMPEAREGALRALDFLARDALAECGAPDRKCAIWGHDVEVGASALAALASAELLRGGDEPRVRELLRGLLGFLRAQQRPDGELMHEYDREQQRPIDIQHMYYSGEAALALWAAYEILGDARDKAAAQRLMGHLTGAGWSFFGSRYFYGEEHWTCQAVARAAPHMDVSNALDFCLRWGGFQRRLQYGPGQTPWQVTGALGVGPVLLPRVTLAASRVEALAPIYGLVRARRLPEPGLGLMLERSIGLLLRSRWDARETHLFARPAAAMGGMPNTPAELTSRADMVQHAGSALLAWAELHTRSD